MEMAIMQDPDTRQKDVLIFSSFFNGLTILAFSLVISLFCNGKIQLEIILISLCSFFLAVQNVAISLANLKERYGAISVSKSLFPILFFGAAFALKGKEIDYPLATSHAISSFLGALIIVKMSGYKVTIVSLREMLKVLQKNSQYIKFDLPSNILNASALLLPAYLIGIFFDEESSGLYFLAYKLVAAPLSAISLAIAYVYRREAVKEFKEFNSFEFVTRKTLISLIFLSSLMLTSFYLIGPWVFGLVFDEKWLAALPIISILMPMFALKLVASSLSFSFYIVGRLKLDLYGQLLFVTIVSVAIYAGSLLNDFTRAVYFTAIGSGFVYLMYAIKSVQFSRGKLQ
jgi:O-antigen/teichoic acid export membrane protein